MTEIEISRILTRLDSMQEVQVRQGQTLARIEERVKNLKEDVVEGQSDRRGLWQKVNGFATQVALLAYVAWDQKNRM